jgi:DNA (cytosine-5)-methyltransferase 1
MNSEIFNESDHFEQDPVVWSLFTGAMGLDLGLELSGLKPALCVEIEKFCCETIRLNRPELRLIQADIQEIEFEQLKSNLDFSEDIYMIAGGPPCQSFSPGGNRAALSDPRGNLIYEFFRIIRDVRPRYFLFENVANIITAALKHRRIEERPGKYWNLKAYDCNRSLNDDSVSPMKDDELSGSAIRTLLEDIRPLGYKISFGILDAADYGSPQHRLRFVMLGSRDGKQLCLPTPTHGPPESGLHPYATLRDAIGDLVENPGNHYNYSEAFKTIFSLVPPGGNWRHLPDETIKRKAMGGSYNSGGGKTGFFRKLHWDFPAPTITGKPNRKGTALCHPLSNRPLSVRECARIQGFPDEWIFAGPMQEQYRQIGNAVPVYLGKALGEAIIRNDTITSPEMDPEMMLNLASRRLRNAARNKRNLNIKSVSLYV